MAPSRWLYIAFQSTHPRRVRRDSGDRYYDSSDVSIHAPTQGATNGFSGHLASSLSFNPRTHAGCDTSSGSNTAPPALFNPRTHAGCDPRPRRPKARSGRFNPRTHAGCDAEGDLAAGVRLVSIHAPTQGATRNNSANGTTPPCFNPRTHAGCDVCHLYASIVVCCVSIHAPTQGATEIRQSQTARRRSFNPRTHAGCDAHRRCTRRRTTCFNPRTHAGCDLPPTRRGRPGRSFQSTHPRRVRLPLRNPFILQQKRDVCEPHPGQFKNATLPSPPII